MYKLKDISTPKMLLRTINKVNIYNPNLLINSDFAINQRGESSYTGANTYTVDRWQHGTSFMTASVLSKGIRLTASTSGTTGANYFLYNQPIENFAKYAGKTVTATVAYENNTFTNGKINIRCDTTSNYSTATMSTSGVITFTLTLPSSITSSLKLIITGNHTNGTEETIDLLYAKLELGSIATPFVPPLIAEELPKCQRYYEKINTAVAANKFQIRKYARSTFSFYDNQIFFKTVKRTLPTVKLFSQSTDTEGFFYNGTASADNAMSVGYVTDYGFICTNTAGNMTANDVLNGYYSADSEIY